MIQKKNLAHISLTIWNHIFFLNSKTNKQKASEMYEIKLKPSINQFIRCWPVWLDLIWFVKENLLHDHGGSGCSNQPINILIFVEGGWNLPLVVAVRCNWLLEGADTWGQDTRSPDVVLHLTTCSTTLNQM